MIRLANYSDLAQVLDVIQDAKNLFTEKGSTQWQDLDGYPNRETFIQDIDNNSLYVKVVDNRVVGVMALSRSREKAYDIIYDGKWLNDDKYYVVHRLAVKKECYGKGYAKELLKFADEVTKSEGVYNIKVDTMRNNIIMQNLLINCGYIECGIILLLRENVLERERVAFQKVLK